MDTTETYIKMCEKAMEIQNGHSFEFDDLCYLPYYAPAKVVVQLQNTNTVDKQGKVWLPRQDQLQEMVEWGRLEQLLDPFISFYNRQPWAGKADGVPPSMEQLWLAFVMKEKYNKTWPKRRRNRYNKRSALDKITRWV